MCWDMPYTNVTLARENNPVSIVKEFSRPSDLVYFDIMSLFYSVERCSDTFNSCYLWEHWSNNSHTSKRCQVSVRAAYLHRQFSELQEFGYWLCQWKLTSTLTVYCSITSCTPMIPVSSLRAHPILPISCWVSVSVIAYQCSACAFPTHELSCSL